MESIHKEASLLIDMFCEILRAIWCLAWLFLIWEALWALSDVEASCANAVGQKV